MPSLASSHLPPTRQSLLARLRGSAIEPADWQRFLELYTPAILAWCRNYGLQEADAQDVTQEVLLRIARCLPKLEYDPRQTFRGWLRTIVHRCWCDWHETVKPGLVGSGNTNILNLLQELPAREELVLRLQAQYDQELLEEAMARVRQRIEPRTWQAFELLAFGHQSGVEAARQTGLKVASTFAARSKVTRMLRDELGRLREERGEEV